MARTPQRLGHGKLTTDLRDMIDQAKSRRGAGSPVPIGRPRGELTNLLEASYPKSRLGDMISFLQMIEQDRSHSIVMAATNHPDILDRA